MIKKALENVDTFIFDFDGTIFNLFTNYDFKETSIKLENKLKEYDIDFPTSSNPFEVFNVIKNKALNKEAYDLANSYADMMLSKIEIDAAKFNNSFVDGAKEIIRFLLDNNYKVAIASNNSPLAIKIVLDREFKDLKLEYIGRDILHIDGLKPSTYMLEKLIDNLKSKKENTIFFGDHPRDLACANALPCRFIAVTPTKLKKDRMLKVISESLTIDSFYPVVNIIKKLTN